MDPIIGSSLIGGIGTIAASALGVGSNVNLNKKNRQWQENMYALQRQHAVEDYNRQLADQWKMIDYQNWYNSYPNQSRLMREAGINPNGSGSPVQGNGSIQSPGGVRGADVPSPVTQGYDFSGFGSGFGQMLSGVIQSGQMDIAREQTAISRQRVNNELLEILARSRNLDADTKSKEISNAFQAFTFDDRVNKLRSEVQRINASAFQSIQTAMNIEFDRLNLKPLEMQKISAGIEHIYAQIQDYSNLWAYRNQLIAESASKEQLHYVESALRATENALKYYTGDSKWLAPFFGLNNTVIQEASRAWNGFKSFSRKVDSWVSNSVKSIKSSGILNRKNISGSFSVPNMLQGYETFKGKNFWIK